MAYDESMKRILVTGVTGNIGREVIHHLSELSTDFDIIAAVRNVGSAKETFKNYPDLIFRQFDFEHEDAYASAFAQIDILFLLRPPHLSDVETVFRPLLKSAKINGITNIVFLSVQGAEKSTVIPHHKIERLIQEMGFNFIFIRPSYFMQNLTTTLLTEISLKSSISLPSGKAKFNWVDVRNIGEVTAILIQKFEKQQNRAYEITGTENRNFQYVAELLSQMTGRSIRYNRVNPIHFYFSKKKEGIDGSFALVMTLLHFLPRLQAEPKISDNYLKLTGRTPTTLKAFINREKAKFTILQKET